MVKLTTGFARQFQTNQILVPHVHNYIARGEFPDEIPVYIHMNKEEDDAFHPSSSLDCARILYAKRIGLLEPEKNTLDQNKNFMFGHFAHGLIYFIVKELGFSTDDDIEWEFDSANSPDAPFRARGFVDIAECRTPDENVLVDIKTVQSRLFADPSSRLTKYEAQVNLYLWFKNKERAIILWIEKDTPHRMKETLIERDDHLVYDILDKWEYVTHCLDKQEWPECTCEPGTRCTAEGLEETYTGLLS